MLNIFTIQACAFSALRQPQSCARTAAEGGRKKKGPPTETPTEDPPTRTEAPKLEARGCFCWLRAEHRPEAPKRCETVDPC